MYLPKTTPEGSSLAVYTLDTLGLKHLRRVGEGPKGRYNLAESHQREWLFLEHTLSCNDLLIQCHALERVDAASSLERFVTERELKRRPGYAWVKGKRVAVVPDGWVHIKRKWQREAQHYISFELDRGTIEQRAFRRKVRNLVAWIEQGYEEQMGVQGLTVAIVTTHSHKRLSQMLQWAKEELTAIGAKDYGELFLLGHFNPALVDPAWLFLSPIWQSPFSPRSECLLAPPR